MGRRPGWGGRPGADRQRGSSPRSLIDLIEYAAVAEELRLRGFPPAELLDRGEFYLRKIRRVARRDRRIERSVVILRDDFLRLRCVQEAQIGFGGFCSSMLLHIFVDDCNRRLREHRQ